MDQYTELLYRLALFAVFCLFIAALVIFNGLDPYTAVAIVMGRVGLSSIFWAKR